MSGTMEPRRYALAYCSGGLLGLITSEQPVEITYRDNERGVAWTGVQVTGGTIAGVGGDTGKTFTVAPGTPWSSRTPRAIAQLSEDDGRSLAASLASMLAPTRVVRGRP